MKTLKKAFTFTLIILFAASNSFAITAAEIKEKMIPIIDLSIYESYSTSDSGSDVWGLDTVAIFSPIYKIDDRKYVLPLYHGGYQRAYQVVVEEEGYRRYREVIFHNTSLSYYQRLTDRFSCKLTGLGRIQFNSETSDESWGDGLYDYRDIGAAIDFNYKFRQGRDSVGDFMAGFEYYMRVYPNYKSLISLIAATAPETDEKDYYGYQLVSGYRFGGKNLSGNLKYAILFKDYTDKKVIGDDGVLDTSTKRTDYLHTWSAGLEAPINKRLSGKLNSKYILNLSNQNYYDTMGTTLNLADDVFTDSYYDYYSIAGGPGITYKLPLGEKKEMSFDVGYEFTYRYYLERKAQESDSTYSSDNEVDLVHAIRANFRYPLMKNLYFVTVGSCSIARSNMESERYYKYDYELYRVACGVNIKY